MMKVYKNELLLIDLGDGFFGDHFDGEVFIECLGFAEHDFPKLACSEVLDENEVIQCQVVCDSLQSVVSVLDFLLMSVLAFLDGIFEGHSKHKEKVIHGNLPNKSIVNSHNVFIDTIPFNNILLYQTQPLGKGTQSQSTQEPE